MKTTDGDNPLKGGSPPYGAPGRYWNNPPFGKCSYYEALITMKAYGKLDDAGVVSTSALLD